MDIGIFRVELSAIVPFDFLRQFNEQQLSSAIRYCRALQIRIERAYVSPEKDKIKTELLAPHVEKIKKLKPDNPSPTCLELLQEYGSMLEEYKISLFAQEMKTLYPVSPKRLKEKWQEILQCC